MLPFQGYDASKTPIDLWKRSLKYLRKDSSERLCLLFGLCVLLRSAGGCSAVEYLDTRWRRSAARARSSSRGTEEMWRHSSLAHPLPSLLLALRKTRTPLGTAGAKILGRERGFVSKGCRCISRAIASVPVLADRKWTGSQVFPCISYEGKNMKCGGPWDAGNCQKHKRRAFLFLAVPSSQQSAEGKGGVGEFWLEAMWPDTEILSKQDHSGRKRRLLSVMKGETTETGGRDNQSSYENALMNSW